MDIELMRRLSPRVNVIPVIGKADTLTPSELKAFKKRVSLGFLGSDSISHPADNGRH
jgi:septin family protein